MAADANPSLNPKPPDLRKSFAAAVKGNPSSKLFSSQQETPSIALKSPESFKGEPATFFSRADINILAKPFRFSLIGKFISGRPSLEAIRKVFAVLNLQSEFHIGLLDSKHVLIRLDNEIDYHRIWLKEQWTIFNYPMRILKWTPDFASNTECPIIPIWILLPSLPIHLHCKEALVSIAQHIGKPLQVDMSTANFARPSVARVCVEVNLTKTLPKRVWIGYEDAKEEGYWQVIQYEALPKYCTKCCIFGHEEKSCGTSQHQNNTTTIPGNIDVRGKNVATQPKQNQQNLSNIWIPVTNRKKQGQNPPNQFNRPITILQKDNQKEKGSSSNTMIDSTKETNDVAKNDSSQTDPKAQTQVQEKSTKQGNDNTIIIEETSNIDTNINPAENTPKIASQTQVAEEENRTKVSTVEILDDPIGKENTNEIMGNKITQEEVVLIQKMDPKGCFNRVNDLDWEKYQEKKKEKKFSYDVDLGYLSDNHPAKSELANIQDLIEFGQKLNKVAFNIEEEVNQGEQIAKKKKKESVVTSQRTTRRSAKNNASQGTSIPFYQ